VVSLAGEIAGKKTQTLQGAEYTYPVINIRELNFVKVQDEEFFRTRNPYIP
jgi:hypothetical protein